MKISTVLVECDGILYRCQYAGANKWRCGRCGKGIFGVHPKIAQSCAVCHARIAEVQRIENGPEPWQTRVKVDRDFPNC